MELMESISPPLLQYLYLWYNILYYPLSFTQKIIQKLHNNIHTADIVLHIEI